MEKADGIYPKDYVKGEDIFEKYKVVIEPLDEFADIYIDDDWWSIKSFS